MQEKAKKRNKWENSGYGRAEALKKQVVASWSALAVSFIVLIASVICPLLELRRLNKSISPLVELAFDAAYRGDGEGVAEAASGIRSIVLEAEKKLCLVAGHRDIAELKRFAGELAALGADGDVLGLPVGGRI